MKYPEWAPCFCVYLTLTLIPDINILWKSDIDNKSLRFDKTDQESYIIVMYTDIYIKIFLVCNCICNRSYDMSLNITAFLDCDNSMYIRYSVWFAVFPFHDVEYKLFHSESALVLGPCIRHWSGQICYYN